MMTPALSMQSPFVPFETHAQSVLNGVRESFAEILESLPGRPARPLDIAKSLRIDKKLAWRITKITQANDPFAAAQYVPGDAALRTFLKAAASAHVERKLVERATHAVARLDELIRVHAGDRSSLEMMLTACATEDRATADLTHRRMAFRGNSYIWGVQAKVCCATMFVRPANDPYLLDAAIVKGFYHLRQLRRDAPLVIAYVRYADSDDVVRHPFVCEPLDPDGEVTHGIGLIREFCSQPVPQIQVQPADAGFLQCQLVSNGVGDTAAITCVEGNVARRLPSRYRNEHNPYGEQTVKMNIPCEALIVDLLVAEGTFGPIVPRGLVYGELLSRTPFTGPNQDVGQLPVEHSVTYLGKGPAVLHTPDVPRYSALARYVFGRLGWEGERFDVYRYRLDYPVVPSTAAIRFDLPEGPEPNR